ncbi:Gfo/Idh/MocA family protein [Pedobacter heparinus]|uniref:Oxidoreductase domain protein n=1 Tax=Pedobacter heparinus (strain ATCC 13125 / DSM 2366 / CIP 104194 / JCM 7457 / NBRC 12017 / NCIMB 9290 / NRRL B-14731 / HIM 762-3) TaxID=485917 RepID=C6Y1T9_PEDHD|nr:Gfo/Idh/MocA family oxidoreductase [Pedobacter heparinus]ACU05081.1 oxidoreductase domain protein [Pedobacter heparinus DSM 2366]
MKRKDFLKTSSSALAAVAGFMILPSYVLGKPFGHTAPSDKVNLACCGIGNRGGELLNSLYKTGLVNVVALCDVDMGAPHTLENMNKFPNAKRFNDFREMFDQIGKEFDAVCIGVPDFSHFPIAMLAMNQGKNVYVEKPMAHTFNEVALMMDAEKKYKVKCQMGNQGHSEENYFQFKAWTEAGIIKDVTAITAFMNNGRRWHGMTASGFLPAQPIPETLDWDKWLSTSAFKDYNKGYINGDWRSWYEFGNGALGDWGAHIIDTAHQFLELGLPTEVNPVKMEGHSAFLFPQGSTLLFKFPKRGHMPACDITWYDGFNNRPELPEGFGEYVRAKNIPPPTAGAANTKRYPGKIIYSKELTFKGGSHGSALEIIPAEKAKEMASILPVVPESPSNHFANFLKACKGEEDCRSSFAIAGPLCQVMALGVLAQRLNTRLVFDAHKKQISNSKIGNELLAGPPPRKGWSQFYKM